MAPNVRVLGVVTGEHSAKLNNFTCNYLLYKRSSYEADLICNFAQLVFFSEFKKTMPIFKAWSAFLLFLKSTFRILSSISHSVPGTDVV